jgi:hypothetical protein
MKHPQPIRRVWALTLALLAAPSSGWSLTLEDRVSAPPDDAIDASETPTPPRPKPIPLPDETRPRYPSDDPYASGGYLPPTAVPVPSPYAIAPQTATPPPATPSGPAFTDDPDYEFDLIVRYGDLEGGTQTFAADHNAIITLTIDSDVVETVWVEGYNVGVAVQPGQPAILKFRAERPGRFAIWYGSAKHQIAVLEIGPPAPTAAGPLPWSFE